MKKVLTFIFGERAAGQPVPPPSFRSSYPVNQPSETDWNRLYSVGARYGHRGSFYENKPSVIKLRLA